MNSILIAEEYGLNEVVERDICLSRDKAVYLRLAVGAMYTLAHQAMINGIIVSISHDTTQVTAGMPTTTASWLPSLHLFGSISGSPHSHRTHNSLPNPPLRRRTSPASGPQPPHPPTRQPVPPPQVLQSNPLVSYAIPSSSQSRLFSITQRGMLGV